MGVRLLDPGVKTRAETRARGGLTGHGPHEFTHALWRIRTRERYEIRRAQTRREVHAARFVLGSEIRDHVPRGLGEKGEVRLLADISEGICPARAGASDGCLRLLDVFFSRVRGGRPLGEARGGFKRVLGTDLTFALHELYAVERADLVHETRGLARL